MTAEVTSTIEGGVNQDNANGFRPCLWCDKSLSGKRPQAKFCDAKCRVNYSRAGKRPRLTSAERSRCQDCAAFDRKCSQHTTLPARGRKDTTYPSPLFTPDSCHMTTFRPGGHKGSYKAEVDEALRHGTPFDAAMSVIAQASSLDDLRVQNARRLNRQIAKTPTHRDDHPADRYA